MGKFEVLKQGQYFGYYDQNGNWIVGQNGPNKPSVEASKKIEKWFHDYGKLFSKNWFRAVGRDLLFAIGLSNES